MKGGREMKRRGMEWAADGAIHMISLSILQIHVISSRIRMLLFV
jgi:hypothetical protein